jgi:hypothetical protein
VHGCVKRDVFKVVITCHNLSHTVTRLLPNLLHTCHAGDCTMGFFTGLLQESGFWSSTMEESNWCRDLRGPRRSWPCLQARSTTRQCEGRSKTLIKRSLSLHRLLPGQPRARHRLSGHWTSDSEAEVSTADTRMKYLQTSG